MNPRTFIIIGICLLFSALLGFLIAKDSGSVYMFQTSAACLGGGITSTILGWLK